MKDRPTLISSQKVVLHTGLQIRLIHLRIKKLEAGLQIKDTHTQYVDQDLPEPLTTPFAREFTVFLFRSGEG